MKRGGSGGIRRRPAENGVVLVNVLAVLALASAVVLIMLETQSAALFRSQRFDEAAQALAIAHGAELSAVAALRRDMLDAPESDHFGEAWAAAAEEDAEIEGGRFTLAVADAQARYNLNNLAGTQTVSPIFRRIAAAAGIDPAVRARIEAGMAQSLPLAALPDIRGLGADWDSVERLSPFVTALPGKTTVNLNTADEAVLAVLLEDPVTAQLIAEWRKDGGLTRADLRSRGIVMPFGAGLTSKFFRIDSDVRIGNTHQRIESLAARRMDRGAPRVDILRRERGRGGDMRR